MGGWLYAIRAVICQHEPGDRELGVLKGVPPLALELIQKDPESEYVCKRQVPCILKVLFYHMSGKSKKWFSYHSSKFKLVYQYGK